MSLWLHEISEADHRILNPLTDAKLMLLGELSRVGPGDRVLDLACGKGELQCRWAARFGCGEPCWIDPPPPGAFAALDVAPDEFASLAGTLDRFEAAGVELVEQVLADGDSWDRYAAAQWWTLAEWLRAHPHDPRVPRVRDFLDGARRSYLEYGRRYLGWGVFLLRAGTAQAFA